MTVGNRRGETGGQTIHCSDAVSLPVQGRAGADALGISGHPRGLKLSTRNHSLPSWSSFST